MKHLKTIAAILIAALTLTGCDKNETSTSSIDATSSAQSADSDSSIVTSDTSSTTGINSSTASTAESSGARESKPENSPTSTSSTQETSKPDDTSEPIYQTEFEQALAVLKNYVYFDFALRPFDLFFPEGIVDETQYIIENATYDENSKLQYDSESIFFKATPHKDCAAVAQSDFSSDCTMRMTQG